MRHLFLSTCLLMSLGGGLIAAAQSKTSDPPQKADKSKQAEAQAPANGRASGSRRAGIHYELCAMPYASRGAISQRITGTVIMHMRVRARLSREDEQALLRFLAP